MAKTILRAATAEAGLGEELARLRAENTELRTALTTAARERDAARQQCALLRAEDGELTGYARATIKARWEGHPEPTSILEGLLEERGQLPRPDQHPTELIALGYRCGGAA